MKLSTIELKKPTRRQVKRFILNSLIILLGNAITALGAAFLIEPMGFVMGGTTGLGILVRNLLNNYATMNANLAGWIVNIVVYAANIVLFIIGVIFLGKKFAMGTLAGTLLYPGFMTLFKLINSSYADAHGGMSIGQALCINSALGSNEPLLACILGAALFGFGIAIVVRVGSSTGGTDIPPLIFHKYFNLPVSTGLWIIDGSILLLQFAAWPTVTLSDMGYGVIITVITSIVISKVAPIGMRRTQVKIISNHYLEIRDLILAKMSRGVTVLYGQTGYLKEDCHMLLTVISHRQLARLKSEVQKIDPQAFMTISIVSEVRGRGFHSDGVDFLMKNEDIEDGMRVVPPEELERGQNGEN